MSEISANKYPRKWDVLSGVAELAWDVFSGGAKMAWDIICPG